MCPSFIALTALGLPALLHGTWSWYVAGPIIVLFVPALMLAGRKRLGISGNFRHICAAVLPSKSPFLRYDWRAEGTWNLLFAARVAIGGFFAGGLIATYLILPFLV